MDSYNTAWSDSNRKDKGVACYVRNICFSRKKGQRMSFYQRENIFIKDI